MSEKDKLQEFAEMVAAMSRARSQAPTADEPSQTHPIVTEDASVDSGPAEPGSIVATPAPQAERENEATTTNHPSRHWPA
jgi:hypothetical protein